MTDTPLREKLELDETSTGDILFTALILQFGLLLILPKYHIGTLVVYIGFVYTATKFYNRIKIK